MRPDPLRRRVVTVGGILLLGLIAAPRLVAQDKPPAKVTIETKALSLPPAEARKRFEELRRASESSRTRPNRW